MSGGLGKENWFAVVEQKAAARWRDGRAGGQGAHWQEEGAEGTEPVVAGDDDDTLRGGEVGGVVEEERAAALLEAAAVEEDHGGKRARAGRGRGETAQDVTQMQRRNKNVTQMQWGKVPMLRTR